MFSWLTKCKVDNLSTGILSALKITSCINNALLYSLQNLEKHQKNKYIEHLFLIFNILFMWIFCTIPNKNPIFHVLSFSTSRMLQLLLICFVGCHFISSWLWNSENALTKLKILPLVHNRAISTELCTKHPWEMGI